MGAGGSGGGIEATLDPEERLRREERGSTFFFDCFFGFVFERKAGGDETLVGEVLGRLVEEEEEGEEG